MLQIRNLSKKGMFSLKKTLKLFCVIVFVTIIGFSSVSCSGCGGSLCNAKWEYVVINNNTNSNYSAISGKNLDVS